jgi:hypothetical protein
MDPSKVVHTMSDLDFIVGGCLAMCYFQLSGTVLVLHWTTIAYRAIYSTYSTTHSMYIQYILSTVKYSTHRTEHTRVRCPTSPPRETAISPGDDRTPHPCAGRDPAR